MNDNQELVRNVSALICFLALGVLPFRTSPLLRDALDESCCIHYIHSTVLDILPLTGNPVNVNVNVNVSPPLRTETSCLIHPPMQVNTSKVPLNQSTGTSVQPSAQCGRLRRSWNHFKLISPLAIPIQQHQFNCAMDTATFHVDNAFGLGSHLYMWSQALCNAWESGYRVQTHNPAWLWMDPVTRDQKVSILMWRYR
jgi:hypothetical protein